MEHQNETLQKIFAIAKTSLVYVFLIFLMFLNAARLSILDMGNITPYFLLMGIYFWLLARPSLLPFYLVFLLGLGLDVISGQVIGGNALAFLLISFVIFSQRRFLKGQAWPVLWVGYGVACLFVGLIHFAVFVLMNWAWPGLLPLLATVVISVLVYPLMTIPMIAIQKLYR